MQWQFIYFHNVICGMASCRVYIIYAFLTEYLEALKILSFRASFSSFFYIPCSHLFTFVQFVTSHMSGTFTEHIMHVNMFCVYSKCAVRRLTVNLHSWELFAHCKNKEHYSLHNGLRRSRPWNNDMRIACTLLPTCSWCSNQLLKWSPVSPQCLRYCQQGSGCCWQAVVELGHS